jgi:hypothetical protein
MKRILVLSAVLAACGPDTAGESADAPDSASGSAAIEAVTQPAAPPVSYDSGVARSVRGRLERAEKDAAARGAEAAEQVREAEGGASTP